MDKLAIPERLRVASSKPVEGSYPSNANTQTESLRKKIQAPLYDAHDPEIVKAYQSLAPDQTAKPINRDLLGEIQIISAVDDFKRKYPDHKILVVYSGAGRHNWLAVPELQRRGFTYSPTALQPMNGSLLDKSVEQPTSEPERTQWRQAAIKNQLGAEQRVLNALAILAIANSTMSNPLRYPKETIYTSQLKKRAGMEPPQFLAQKTAETSSFINPWMITLQLAKKMEKRLQSCIWEKDCMPQT